MLFRSLHLDGAAPEFRSEHRLRCGSGKYQLVLCRAEADRGRDGRVTRLAGSAVVIEDRKADSLTGLPNRGQFLERLDAVLAKGGTKWAVLLLDLDDFAVLNEHRGHEIADRVLWETGTRLRRALQDVPLDETPELARIGADEFGVLFVCDEIGRAHV